MNDQQHEIAEKLYQQELANKQDGCEAEAQACLLATEHYLQEIGVEVKATLTHVEPNYFTVCVRLSDGYSVMATNRIYLEEDLDLHRYVHLELWTLLDHRKLDKAMLNIYDDNYKPENYNHSGRLSELIPMWRGMEKNT